MTLAMYQQSLSIKTISAVAFRLRKESLMKKTLLITLIVISSASTCFAQASGNIGYSQSGGNRQAEQNERNKRAVGQAEAPPTATTMFVEANVLMNLKADEY